MDKKKLSGMKAGDLVYQILFNENICDNSKRASILKEVLARLRKDPSTTTNGMTGHACRHLYDHDAIVHTTYDVINGVKPVKPEPIPNISRPLFLGYEHKRRWDEAMVTTKGIRDNGTYCTEIGSALILLTMTEELYDAVKSKLRPDFIDIDAMLQKPLSTWEKTIITLAGNLYNGFWDFSRAPIQTILYLDEPFSDLAAAAFLLRVRGF